MNKLILFISILCLSSLSYGQTKKIALKSHAGNMVNFSISGSGNLGWSGPEPVKRSKSKVDTVAKTAMIYDSVCTYQFILDSTKTKSAKRKQPKKNKKKK